ncbi:MAG: hypothetical protein ACHWZW_06395 [Spirulina sp.]
MNSELYRSLYRTLCELPSENLDLLIDALNMPTMNRAGLSASNGDKVTRLLGWAKSSAGPGLNVVVDEYSRLSQQWCSHLDNSPPPLPPPLRPLSRNDAPPAQPKEQRGGWRELLRSTEAIVAIAGIIVGLPAILLIIFDFIKPSPPELGGFQPHIPIALQEATQIAEQIAEPASEPSYVRVEGSEAAIDEVTVSKAKSLDAVGVDYSATTETNPHYVTFLDNSDGKRYGERLTGNISPQSHEGVPGRGWIRIRCLEGQKIIFTSIQGSTSIVLYDPDGYPVELYPSRFLPEGQSIQGVLNKVRQGQPQYLVYKVELQNQTPSVMSLDVSIMCE